MKTLIGKTKDTMEEKPILDKELRQQLRDVNVLRESEDDGSSSNSSDD